MANPLSPQKSGMTLLHAEKKNFKQDVLHFNFQEKVNVCIVYLPSVDKSSVLTLMLKLTYLYGKIQSTEVMGFFYGHILWQSTRRSTKWWQRQVEKSLGNRLLMHPKNEVAFQSRLNCCNYDGARIGLDRKTGCCCHFLNALRYSYPLPFRTLNSISSLSSQEGLYQIKPHRKPRHVRVLQTLDARTYRMF